MVYSDMPNAVTDVLDRAVDVRDIARELKRYGLTQPEIGMAAGASERSVRNWMRSSAIRPSSEERLRELRDIVILLRETLTPRGVGQWLRARNRMLQGRRPLDLLVEGNAQAVRGAAESYVEGGYV